VGGNFYRFPREGQNMKKQNVVRKKTKSHFLQVQGGGGNPPLPAIPK